MCDIRHRLTHSGLFWVTGQNSSDMWMSLVTQLVQWHLHLKVVSLGLML